MDLILMFQTAVNMLQVCSLKFVFILRACNNSQGTSEHDENAKGRMQGKLLASDMAAFKAANPKGGLEDFVRWHSPKDWITDAESGHGHISNRIVSPLQSSISISNAFRSSRHLIYGQLPCQFLIDCIEFPPFLVATIGACLYKLDDLRSPSKTKGHEAKLCPAVLKVYAIECFQHKIDWNLLATQKILVQGGMWKDLWRNANACPVHKQAPLMDPVLEGERALHWFEAFASPANIWQLLISLLLSTALACLSSSEACKIPIVAGEVKW